MSWFKLLMEKWACKHEWEIAAKSNYLDGDNYMLICKKCGKIKTIKI